jgi:hypothetical protein
VTFGRCVQLPYSPFYLSKEISANCYGLPPSMAKLGPVWLHRVFSEKINYPWTLMSWHEREVPVNHPSGTPRPALFPVLVVVNQVAFLSHRSSRSQSKKFSFSSGLS